MNSPVAEVLLMWATHIILYQNVKGKGHPMTCLCRHRGEAEVQLQPIRYLGARRRWVVSTTIRPLYPWERPSTHCTGVWVDLMAGLDGQGKSRPERDSIPQPTVSCYINYAIPTTLKYSQSSAAIANKNSTEDSEMLHCKVWWMVMNISEEFAASIFRT